MIQDQERRMLPAAAVAAGISGLIALILLGIQLPADAAIGVTASDSPFTDEGWYVLGARNQALLGRLATDEWQLAWATLPFTLVVTAAFEIFDVGIVQARVVSVVCSAAAVAIVAALVTRRLGIVAGIVAGVATATSSLLLFYGRLAILEPMVALFLAAGLVVLLSRGTNRQLARGVAAGAAFALAIGTKPSAAMAVAGIVIGAIVAGRAAGLGRRTIAAVGTIVVAGLAWAIAVIPQPGVLDSILRIWAVQTAPGSARDVAQRVIDYVGESDLAIPMAAPLLVGSLIGVGLVAVRWRSLDPGRRALAGAATGWVVLGMATLLVASYRPSRYVVPMLPAMAILSGFAVALALERIRAARGAAGLAVVTAALCIGVALAGVRDLAAWTAAATYRLPQIQAELLDLVTDGHALEGAGGPTFAMRVPVPAIVVRPGLNDGDLYATHRVRWLLVDSHARPAWAADHPDAWAARERLACYPWPSGEACLIRVP